MCYCPPPPDGFKTAAEDKQAAMQMEQAKYAAALHSQSLLSALETINAAINNGHSKEQLIAHLSAAQTHDDGVISYLSSSLEPKYYNEIKPEGSIVASGVLSMPEVLELILLHLDHDDITSMSRVSHNISDIINSSAKLQVRLYHKATNASNVEHLEMLSSFYYGKRKSFRIDLISGCFSTDHVYAHFSIFNGRLPKIGAAWKRKLICQPPIKKIIARVLCDMCTATCPPASTVESETGLTVGDLYEKAERLLRLSKSRSLQIIDADGTTFGDPPCQTVGIVFQTYGRWPADE